VRVTTAKYYTPSGRLIQREYKGKNVNEYYAELADSSWASEDSIAHRPRYQTEAGRLVYGGGGIRPDVVIPYESFPKSPRLINKMLSKRAFFEYANVLGTNNPPKEGNLIRFAKEYEINQEILNDYKRFCLEQEVEIDDEAFNKDTKYISARIKAEIARHYWDKVGFYYVWLHYDNQFLTALKSFGEAKRIALLSEAETEKDKRNY